MTPVELLKSLKDYIAKDYAKVIDDFENIGKFYKNTLCKKSSVEEFAELLEFSIGSKDEGR